MSADFTLPQLDSRVLSTLNADGSRRWISPREVRGRFWRARAIVGGTLIVIFSALPWLSIRGKPPILLDLAARQFTFFGLTLQPTETLLFALFMLAVFVAVFLLTAIFGRVWCGWGCPQTIYIELLYRPIERFFIGARANKSALPVPAWRLLAMYGTFLLLSAHLSNTFLAYFVGTNQLVGWTLRSPTEHPVAFGFFAGTVALMMFDFAFFREQLCTIVCPYGRLQSVLLDRDSLLIGYDTARGEPRAKAAARRERAADAPAGDCVDCKVCAQVCPTGIDIRDGLQLECVNCAQCIDACDEIMLKIGKPRGLIRYTTQNRLAGGARRRVRVRLIAYPLLLTAIVTLLVTLLVRREWALVEQARMTGVNFTILADGAIASPVRLLIENRTDESGEFILTASATAPFQGGAPRVRIDANGASTVDFSVISAADDFHGGRRIDAVRVASSGGFKKTIPITIAGPFTLEKRK